MVIYTLLGLVGPYLMGVAIDRFIIPKQLAGLGAISLLMLVTYALNNLFQAIAGWLMAGVSQRALKDMRGDLFAHLQRLPISFFDRQPAGELMSRMTNDIDVINQAVSQNVTALLASVLTLVGILIAMFVLDAWLALSALLVVPIMFWFTNFVARYTRRGFRDLQKHLGEMNGVMEEAISGQKVVKAFRRNESVVAAFRERNQAVYKAGVYANSYALLLMPLTNVLGNLFVIVLAGLGGLLALQGLVTVGIIATFIIYGQNFIQPLRQLANIYNTIQAALAGAERVFEIIDTPGEIDEATDARHSITRNAARRCEIRSRPLQLPARSADHQRHDAGSVRRTNDRPRRPDGRGQDDDHQPADALLRDRRGADHHRRHATSATSRRPICAASWGWCCKTRSCLPTPSWRTSATGGLDATDEECMQAAKLADADHFIHQLPHGYQTLLSERASNLSQGQRQLLSISRAILADPGILILDEATSSVDTRTEARIQKSLLRLMQGRTSFVIAHRLSTIRDADQVVVIDHGEIVERGTHQELLDQRGFYHHLYVSQFKGEAI